MRWKTVCYVVVLLRALSSPSSREQRMMEFRSRRSFLSAVLWASSIHIHAPHLLIFTRSESRFASSFYHRITYTWPNFYLLHRYYYYYYYWNIRTRKGDTHSVCPCRYNRVKFYICERKGTE